jgi:hypothetical protein
MPSTNLKGLFLAGLLLAGPQLADAQVYSSNIVGYVNVTMTNGLYFVNTSLENAGYDSLNDVMGAEAGPPPDGCQVYVWDVTNQVFLPPAVYNAAQTNWSINYDVPPGRGFVINTPSAWTWTVVGDVLQGSLTNYLAGHNKLSLVGSQVPIAGPITAELGFPGIDGETVYFYNNTNSSLPAVNNPPGTVGGSASYLNFANQDFHDACIYFSGYGWYDPKKIAGPGGPNLNVGESFFARTPGPDTNWVFYFSVGGGAAVQPAMAAVAATAATPVAAADATAAATKASRIHVRKGQVRLQPVVQDGRPYDIQFSTDGCHWRTVTTNCLAVEWAGPVSGTGSGFYRLVGSRQDGGSK